MMTEDGRISFLGVNLEHVPTWLMAVVVFALTVAIGVAAYRTIWSPKDLVTLREANSALQETVDEYNLHIGEQPEGQATLMDDARGKLVALRYRDGCTVLSRTSSAGVKAKLIIDLARDEHRHARNWPDPFSVSAAGKCLDPHPGTFKTWYGEKQGCWVPVFREFSDGCRHVQMFDACHSVFAGDVKWLVCLH